MIECWKKLSEYLKGLNGLGLCDRPAQVNSTETSCIWKWPKAMALRPARTRMQSRPLPSPSRVAVGPYRCHGPTGRRPTCVTMPTTTLPLSTASPSAEAKLHFPFSWPSREATSAMLLAPRCASASYHSTPSDATGSTTNLEHRA
jgi:hypothetical protein